MHKFSLVIVLLITAAASAFAQTTAKSAEPNDSAEETVLRVTQEWVDADERQDRAALDKLIASDFLGTAPGGRTVYKRDILPPEGTTRGHGLGITTRDVKARVFGDTAIVSGSGVSKNAERPERGELRFTVFFVKRADRWQMVAAHLSPVPPPE